MLLSFFYNCYCYFFNVSVQFLGANLTLFSPSKRIVTCIQCSNGLHHRSSHDMEFWCRRDDMYTLERTVDIATGLLNNN